MLLFPTLPHLNSFYETETHNFSSFGKNRKSSSVSQVICRQAPGQHPGLQLQTHTEHNTAINEYLDQAEKSDRLE